jgi:two-component system, NtrC family, response regulator GlrR
MSVDENGATSSSTVTVDARAGALVARAFELHVIEGPAVGQVYPSTGTRCSIGSHSLNDLVLDDSTVSRFHCEVNLEPSGVLVQDLNSRNGTVVDGVTVREAFLKSGSLLRMGNTVVRFELGTRMHRVPVSERTRFGSLVGRSIEMRAAFGWLERAARSNATVLLEGETGTGKGAAARSIHEASARSAGPFVVIDCGAVPRTLLESELFGHEKGAFTGASLRRIGAFEAADGGTVFLDELGELPQDLQPMLLGVLENRAVRRIGGNTVRPVDVRLIAATNRDLRSEVNLGRFRADLYFRLAVIKITLPPLRRRPEDLPALVDSMLETLQATREQRAFFQRPELLADLTSAAWPGNVRELRNHIERCLVFPDEVAALEPEAAEVSQLPVDVPLPTAPSSGGARLPLIEARRLALEAFERQYLQELLHAHRGKVSVAAKSAEITRVYLYKLLKKYGLSK